MYDGVDVSGMSETELREMIASAEKALQKRRETRKQEVVAEIKRLAAEIGVTAVFREGQAAPSGLKGRKVAVKYRDPSDPLRAWTGRGVKPTWLVRYLGQGRSLEEFAVE